MQERARFGGGNAIGDFWPVVTLEVVEDLGAVAHAAHARIVGTVFISRNPRQADAQRKQLKAELDAGRKLLFFPEGTSTDGMRVLPFKSSLFAAFSDLESGLEIQPVTVVYIAPTGRKSRVFTAGGAICIWGPTCCRCCRAFRKVACA